MNEITEIPLRLDAEVSPDMAGMRLDQVAALLFPDYSRGRLQKWIRSGDLTVDGATRKPTLRLAGNEFLRLEARLAPEGVVQAQAIPLDVLYEDGDLLVLDKPAGMVVHPAAGNPDGTLQNALLHFDSSLQTLPRSGIVHRLDKDTSGVMVVARSLRAHTSLVEQLQRRSMSRTYRAIACGQPSARGSVDAPVGRHPRNRVKMAVVPNGKPAVSHYRVLRRMGDFSYLEVSLETGRTHQIRVHMAHIGCPLVGDPVYAGAACRKEGESRGFNRQALHAWRLKLVHPANRKECQFEAPLPDDFEALLKQLKTS
jgi:23S rRNA pseudouridine1911/1915/1917 synthase